MSDTEASSKIAEIALAMMVAISVTPSSQRGLKFGGLLISGVSAENYAHVFRDTPVLLHLFNKELNIMNGSYVHHHKMV